MHSDSRKKTICCSPHNFSIKILVSQVKILSYIYYLNIQYAQQENNSAKTNFCRLWGYYYRKNYKSMFRLFAAFLMLTVHSRKHHMRKKETSMNSLQTIPNLGWHNLPYIWFQNILQEQLSILFKKMSVLLFLPVSFLRVIMNVHHILSLQIESNCRTVTKVAKG